MSQMTRVSIQKKHVSLNKEYSQTTQKETLLTAPLPKSDRAQLSRQALVSLGTKYESSKKAPWTLTCFSMSLLISTDTKKRLTALHWHEKGTRTTEAAARDALPPRKPCARGVGLLSLPCAGSKATLGPCVHKPPFQPFATQAKPPHERPFPKKTQGGQKMGVHASPQTLRACSFWQAAGAGMGTRRAGRRSRRKTLWPVKTQWEA